MKERKIKTLLESAKKMKNNCAKKRNKGKASGDWRNCGRKKNRTGMQYKGVAVKKL